MLQTNTRNFNFREFQRVHFKKEISENTSETIENNEQQEQTRSKVYTDIRIDLYTIILYGHFYDQEEGRIDFAVTEIYIDGITEPILIRMPYFTFNQIMLGLPTLNP